MAIRREPGRGSSAQARPVLRLLPSIGILIGATGFASLAASQALRANPAVVMAMGALIPFGVLVLLVSVPLVLALGGGGGSIDPGSDGEDGGGGPPPPPDDPDPEPPWWPSFEDDFRRYLEDREDPDRRPHAPSGVG